MPIITFRPRPTTIIQELGNRILVFIFEPEQVKFQQVPVGPYSRDRCPGGSQVRVLVAR